jgi:uncharacterized protein YfiM (DUF2279 family)
VSSSVVCAHLLAASLALHPADLPHAFAATHATGSATSYRVEFARVNGAAGLQEGPLEIDSTAVVYPGQAAARAALRRAVPRHTAGLAVGYRLGDAAHEYVVQLGSALGALLRYTIVWREGSVDASVTVTGRVGVVSAADLAAPARAQQARIVRAATRARRSCPPHA